MGFMNIHNTLIMDNNENIYSFYIYEKKIKMILYEKNKEKPAKRTIIDDCLEEYDSAISDDGTVYLVCQKTKGDIVLVSIDGYKQEEHLLAEGFDTQLRNLNIKIINNKIHIVYCVASNEDSSKFRIYHHNLIDEKWNTHVISDISIRDILNPFSIIELDNNIILGYYDIVDNVEQIFIKIYNLSKLQWSEKFQLTTDNSMKMYLDMISHNNDEIDICYSNLIDGNFVVKYEKYNIKDEEIIRVTEHILSNPANCMYPTFINCYGKLWNIWIEYNGLMSCFSEDGGLNWSYPYSWENFKKENFARYKFSTNNSSVIYEYRFNYGFGTYGDNISFIGFGDIENAVEVPLISELKKKEFEQNSAEVEITSRKDVDVIGDKIKVENSKFEKEIAELKEKVQMIEEAIKTITEILESKISEVNSHNQDGNKDEIIAALEKRIGDIEQFLNRRRRGLLR